MSHRPGNLASASVASVIGCSRHNRGPDVEATEWSDACYQQRQAGRAANWRQQSVEAVLSGRSATCQTFLDLQEQHCSTHASDSDL